MADSNFTPQELESEEWRDAPGYEGFYEVSTLGRVRRAAGSFSAPRARILAPRKGKNGYIRLHLSKNGVVKNVPAHQLVCEAFHGPPPPGHQTNHKNGNKTDNRPQNLEWVTVQENIKHRDTVLGHGKKGGDNPFSKIDERDVRTIRWLYATGKYTHRDIADMFPVGRACISHILNFRTWAHVN